MTKCAILGASGHGKVVAEIAELNGYKEIHFFDDKFPKLANIEYWSVIGDSNSLLNNVNAYDLILVAIGNNQIRVDKQRQLLNAGARVFSLIHPQAVVSSYATLGIGTVVMAGSVISPFARLGDACIVNTGASIDHDCQLADGVHVSPGARLAGAVKVGYSSWIGIGAQVKQLISIGDFAVVGAGATVIDNVPNNQTVVGTPAKIINKTG